LKLEISPGMSTTPSSFEAPTSMFAPRRF